MRIVLITPARIDVDNRARKFAVALTQGGHEVVRVGIRTSWAEPEHEVGPDGVVRRVLTSRRGLDAARSDSPRQQAEWTGRRSGLSQALSDVRHFLGRMRENLYIYRAIVPLRPDVVISCDPPTMPAGYLLRAFSGAALVYDSRELWLEQTNEVSRLFRFLYGSLERHVIRHADAAIAVNEEIADELARRYGVRPPTAVYNGADSCVHTPTPVGAPLRLFFQGAFVENRGLCEMILAMKKLSGIATLTLQGFGPQESELRALVASESLEDEVSFIDPCDPEEVVACATGFDVGVATFRDTSLNTHLAAPNKLFDYLGAGLAVLSTDLPVMRRILDQGGCGQFLQTPSPESIADAVKALASDPARVAEMKMGAAGLCDRYSWQRQAEVLQNLVEAAVLRRDSRRLHDGEKSE